VVVARVLVVTFVIDGTFIGQHRVGELVECRVRGAPKRRAGRRVRDSWHDARVTCDQTQSATIVCSGQLGGLASPRMTTGFETRGSAI